MPNIPVIPFQPALLSFLIVCLLLYACIFIFNYSYYFTSKNIYYKQIKIRVAELIIAIIFTIVFIVVLIIICLYQWVVDIGDYDNNMYMFYMIPILLFFSIIHLISVCLMPKLVNKNKPKIEDFSTTNFVLACMNIEHEIHHNDKTLIIEKRFHKYNSKMNEDYIYIKNRIIDMSCCNYQTALLDILMFNELHTTKWSKNYNNVQLKLFFDLCITLQNSSLCKLK